MKKNVIIGVLVTALVALGIWGYTREGAGLGYQRSMEDSYVQDFEQLMDSVRDMSSKLNKCAVSNDQGFLAYSYFEISKLAAVSQDLLTRLPLSQPAISKSCEYLSKTEDFCAAMVRKFTNGESITSQDRASTAALAKSAKAFEDSLSSFVAERDENPDSFKWGDTASKADAYFMRSEEHLFTKSLTGVDESMIDYPTMIYDGPYSDHLINPEVRGLTGEEMTSDQVAAAIKKEYASSGQVKYAGEVGGTVPMYGFEITNGGESSRIMYFSKTGGHLIMAQSSQPPSKGGMSMDEAGKKAAEFLEKLGIEGMEPSYYESYSNSGIFNFCYTQNGVKVYADLIKVQVSLEDGKIIGYEASGYYMNHAARLIPAPKITETAARANISSDLKVTHTALALIPTSGKNEVLCYEFKGTVGEEKYIVYVDAATGRERQIFIVIEGDGSVLVL